VVFFLFFFSFSMSVFLSFFFLSVCFFFLVLAVFFLFDHLSFLLLGCLFLFLFVFFLFFFCLFFLFSFCLSVYLSIFFFNRWKAEFSKLVNYKIPLVSSCFTPLNRAWPWRMSNLVLLSVCLSFVCLSRDEKLNFCQNVKNWQQTPPVNSCFTRLNRAWSWRMSDLVCHLCSFIFRFQYCFLLTI